MSKLIDGYHEHLISVWSQHRSSDVPGFERVPYFGQAPLDAQAVEVLFLGLNPSYDETVLRAHWDEVHGRDRALSAMGLRALRWDEDRTPQDWTRLRPALVALDRHSRLKYAKYYRPIELLAEQAGASGRWHHLDLLPVRQTHQKALVPFLPVPEEVGEEEAPRRRSTALAVTLVLEELMSKTVKLIGEFAPKVVVVLNSHASKVLEHRLPLVLQDNGHRYGTSLLPGVPFLLSSQLSGGATSKYGRQRLLADLRDVLRSGSGLNGGALPA